MQIIDRKFLNVTTPSCHASTICFFKDRPICAYFGGSREGAEDVAIYIECWGKTHIIGESDPIPRWKPILYSCDNQLYLFVKIGIFCDRWGTMVYNISDIFEEDFDIKKAICQTIPAGLNGPVKTKIIENKGLLYCGSSVETIIDWSSYIEIYKLKEGGFEYLDRSRPLIVPKKTYKDIYGRNRKTMGIIQPSLWYDGKKMNAFFRSSKGLGKIYYSSSYKNSFGTLNWSDPVETKFDNPNSGIDTVYKDDRLFLVHNPSETYRYPLIISELDKEFNVIDEIVVQEKTEGSTNTTELSYPYLIKNENKLYLTYTYGRKKIEQVTIGI